MAADAIRIELLPARLGDCLLVECLRGRRAPWRMLVDGGPPDTWPLLQQRLAALAADGQVVDVAVVTHIDSDHIGGIVPLLADPAARDLLGDVWFNGEPQLPERPRSVGQGEQVGAGIAGEAGRPALPWNAAFGGGAVDVGEPGGFIELDVPDGPHITVLSPTTKRLTALGRRWRQALAEAATPHDRDRDLDTPAPLTDLAPLSVQPSSNDGSTPNGSSIALLLEHRGASVLLGADAFSSVLTAGLGALARHRGLDVLTVDAVKVPHHGSRANVSRALVSAVPARHYLVSTNGDTFRHPDDEAIARIVVGAPTGATLWFNYRTPRTARWDDPTLRAEHGYAVRFPEDDASGVVLTLPALAGSRR
ncbi:MAG TPA: MBL fold metallo-hydrolase [Lapillicoccus sp.]|nr:MBL fold metallo-hydrolase [Lapillicoccus sp.]